MDVAVHAGPAQRLVVYGPSHHHPIHVGQLVLAFRQRQQTAVDLNGDIWSISLELVHQVVAQRRDGAVLLWIQTIQPGLAGMHCEAAAACRRQGVHKVEQFGIGVAIINANPVLYRHWQGAGGRHRFDTAGHLVGIGHQTSPKATFAHLLARATQIEVHLVVVPVGRQAHGLGQQPGIIPPQLQGQGFFARIEADQPFQASTRLGRIWCLAGMVQRLGHHHFAVQQAVQADLTHQHAKMPIGVVQHWRHTEAITQALARPVGVLHCPMLLSHAS